METKDIITISLSVLSFLLSIISISSTISTNKKKSKVDLLNKVYEMTILIDKLQPIMYLTTYSELLILQRSSDSVYNSSTSDIKKIFSTSITNEPFSKSLQEKIEGYISLVSLFISERSCYALSKEQGEEEKRMEFASKVDIAMVNMEAAYNEIKVELNNLKKKYK